MLEKRPQKPRPDGIFKGFMYDHGRTIADSSSYLRLGFGLASAAAVLTERYRLAQGLHLVGMITDKCDGTAAGMSKGGPTKDGGKLDQQVDKVFTLVTEAALAVKGDVNPAHPILRTGRDALMNKVVRPSYEQQGIETSAAMSGKASTAAVLIADNLSMSTFGREHPKLTRSAHWLATSLKWYSMFDSPRTWKRRHAENGNQVDEATVFDARVA